MSFVWWKALAALALAPLAFDRPRRAIEALWRGQSRLAFVGVFAASRLAACLLAFVVLDLPLPGDVRGYYTAFADAVLASGRHELSPYSAGFDYLLAAMRRVSGSSLSFILLMIGAEVAALATVLRVLDRHRPECALPIGVLWLVSPVSLFHIALGGQDEALILLAWSLVAWLALTGRTAAAGAAVTMGIACTKFLGLFAALPLVGQPRRSVARAAAAAVALGGVLALLQIQAGIPLGNLASESRLVTSGNLWALPAIAMGWGRPSSVPGLLVVGVVVLAVAGVYMHLRPWARPIDQVLRVAGTMGCLFLLVSQKSFATYLVIFLPGVLFLALEAPALERAFLLGLVLPVVAFEPSLWFYFREGKSLVGALPGRVAMLTADVTLIAGYLLVVRHGLQPFRGGVPALSSGGAR